MTDLIHLTIPLIGRVYIQHDTITLCRWELERLRAPWGDELLLCCGRIRLYLTHASTIRAEGRS